MLNKLRLPTLAVAATLALGPTTAMARDRDDIRHERHEAWEHRRFVNPGRFYIYRSPVYVYPFATGYYDDFGFWHPYAEGRSDRWGFWHPYH
jgi:hypothetical protein